MFLGISLIQSFTFIMNIFKITIFLTFLSQDLNAVHGFVDPVAMTVTSLVGIGYYLFSSDSPTPKSIRENIVQTATSVCQKIGYCEGCEDYWIPNNIQGLEYDLKNNVFGQPFAIDITLGALKHHLHKTNKPDRALMLSFNGGPGTGKNFISQKIIDNMFKMGKKSKYVHIFKSSIEFPEMSKVDEYKRTIVNLVKEKVLECHRSIFVFDEVEKLPNGVLDVLSGFVKYTSSGEYDYKRVIFILLSNIGTLTLQRETLNSWKNGIPRESINMGILSSYLSNDSFNAGGGLHKSGLVQSYSISHYVPFLPLEKVHVVQCLQREVSKQHQVMSNELEQQVLDELPFGPAPEYLFALSGCKQVAEKASSLIERERRRQQRKNP